MKYFLGYLEDGGVLDDLLEQRFSPRRPSQAQVRRG